MSCQPTTSPSPLSQRRTKQLVVAAPSLAVCLLFAASCTSTDEPAGFEIVADQPGTETAQDIEPADQGELRSGQTLACEGLSGELFVLDETTEGWTFTDDATGSGGWPMPQALSEIEMLVSMYECVAVDDVPVSADPADEPEAALAFGTREHPWALNTATEIVLDTLGDGDGSIWSVTVGDLSDATERMVASNPFDEAPSEGVVFAMFALDMTLLDADKVPLSTGWNLYWEIFGGASNTVYDAWTMDDAFCWLSSESEFSTDTEAYPGGTLSGEVCIPLPVEDLDHPDTQLALSPSTGDRIMFAADGTPAELPRVPVLETGVNSGSGEGTRTAPNPYGTTSTFTMPSFSDAAGSVWELTMSAPQDITASVLDENMFNEQPSEGYVYAGFDVSLTLVEGDIEPVNPGWDLTFEIHGGETLLVFDDMWGGCGSVPDEVDLNIDVLVGGTVSGTACMPVPIEDLDSPSTQVAVNYGSGNRVFFN